MDTIFINELKVKTKLGVPAWESMLPQTVILDIELGYDLSAAGKSDAITDTIDYGAVVAHIHKTLGENSFMLVEKLAQHVCDEIFAIFKPLSIKIKVSKPAILPGLKALGVVIERKANGKQ